MKYVIIYIYIFIYKKRVLIYIVKIIKVGEAAKILGMNTATLRAWEKTGELLPFRKSKKGTRYYI